MKSLAILQAVLADASQALDADTSRDFMTIESRHKHEGDAFISITLPSFGSWLERSIELGEVEPSIYTTFRRKSGSKSVLPCFLHGLTALVFEPDSGKLREDANVNAVFFIRQICLLFKKIKTLCTTRRVEKSLRSFVETDISIRKALPVGNQSFGLLEKVSKLFASRLASVYPSTIDELPKHGPGATSDCLRGNAKYYANEFYQQWQNVFSIEEIYGFQAIDVETPFRADTVPPVKVIAVPKTMKAARIIAVESTAMQFAQQYVSMRLRVALERAGFMRQLNLQDQSVNQRLALHGSRTGALATLDLSEASDRLSAKMVHWLFRSAPEIRRHLFACRTPTARIGKQLLTLKKFASMGSALTFPVESYAFFVIAVAAVMRYHETEGFLSRSPFTVRANAAARRVFVFGDDIIVPADAASYVIDLLEDSGLRVNRDKSFVKGLFRESCGTDAFKGFKITPVYIRSYAPRSMRDATEFVSTVSTGNQMFLAGLWQTAELIQAHCDSIRKLELVSTTSNLVGWHTFQNARTYSHYDSSGHPRLRSVGVRSRKIPDPLDGDQALRKALIRREPTEDATHLQKSTSRYSMRLCHKSGTP